MDELRRILKEYDQRLENLEKGLVIKKITIPIDGYFVVQKLTADPSSPIEGQLWENVTTHHLKIYLNGSVTTII